MKTMDTLRALLGDVPEDALEVRIRANRAAQFRCFEGEQFGPTVTADSIPGLLAAVMLIHGGLVSIHGIMGASLDGVAMKAAQAAVESVVPVIGGGVSDALGAILGSAGTAKGVLGVTGVALLVRLCLTPLVKLGAGAAALRLIAAVTEPLSDGAASTLIGRFGELMALMFATGVCAVVMAAMLPACFAAITASL